MVRLQLAKGSVEEGLAAFDALLAMEDVDADLRREFDSLRSRLSVVYPERYQIVFPGRDAFSDLSWYEIHDRVDRSLQSGSHAALQASAMDWLAFDIAESGGQRRSSTTDRLLQLLMRIAMDNDDLDGAIRLMSDAPFWSKDYLVEDYDRDVLPPDYLARLIEGVHGTEQAVEFLTHAMAKRPGDDAIYRSLVDRLGGDALQLFQAQVERSPFEERPLIWMAQVHLDAGEAAKAEALCRQAIAVDPSDGEQGKGDRMRVYAVLAEALAAQGDDEQADFFRRVVASIRHSENADDWRRAGLASTAIEMYAKGIEMFSDAYCIQSRIAKELAEQGRWEEAQRHYQRAFELMPDSFGRMESHCFGCEGAFSGKLVQALAEKVFLGRIEKDEGNPRAHYLLGYLRLEQKDHEAALASFRRAVELDPDYINAWKRYAQVAASAGLSREEQLAINRALLRLDPYQEHVSIDTISSGFAEIWSDIDQRELPSEPPKPGKLLPLAKKPMNDRGMGFGFTSYRSHGSRGEAATAFQLFAQENPVIDLLNDKFSQFTR
jgi:tetratricopeptide (TPR) repeat protein